MKNESMSIKITEQLRIKSSVFEDNMPIPKKYTCDGNNTNPPIDIFGVSGSAKSLIFIVEDPDAPAGIWDHWIKFNISPNIESINEGSENFGISGKGTSGNLSYLGPCPPNGTHRYVFKLLALDVDLQLKEGATKNEILKAATGHILQQATTTGLYKR